MFNPARWADAFAELCGKDIAEGVEVFRVFASALGPLRPGTIAGTAAAARLERVLRESLDRAGFGAGGRGAEIALRFTCLLVRRDFFRHRLALLGAVEKAADRARGILRARVESAVRVTAEFEDELRAKLLKMTGAREVALTTRINAELLAGYRLHVGTNVLDTSLREKIRMMRRDLSREYMAGAGGGTE